MKTLTNADSAKHIAKQHGLQFTYQRSARMWLLASPSFNPAQSHSLFASSVIAEYSVDQFYYDCMRVAAYSMTPAQMDMAIARERYLQALDDADGRKLSQEEQFTLADLANAARTTDKQVLSMHDAIYNMRMDAEEISGTYHDHKMEHAECVVIASYKTGRTRANGKPESAIGYEVNGVRVMSLPARLNSSIPELDEVARILAGKSIEESPAWNECETDVWSSIESTAGNNGTGHDVSRVEVAGAVGGYVHGGEIIAYMVRHRDTVRAVAAYSRAINPSDADMAYKGAIAAVNDVVAACPGSHTGAAMTVRSTPDGLYFFMWRGQQTHRIAVAHTSRERLAAHWSGFVNDNSEQAYIEARGKVHASPAASHIEHECKHCGYHGDYVVHCPCCGAPRVNLTKSPEPVGVYPAVPVEPIASVYERVTTLMRAKRLASVPAEPCDQCGAVLESGRTGLCDDCIDVAAREW